MCCGVIPILFGWYLRVQSLHVLVFTHHTRLWESMGKPCSCTQFIKSRILYYKSRACVLTYNETEASYHYHHSTKLCWKEISLIFCHWHCYSCCTLVTIQTARYFPEQLCAMVIPHFFEQTLPLNNGWGQQRSTRTHVRMISEDGHHASARTVCVV